MGESSPMIEQALELVRRAMARQHDDPVASYEEASGLAERIDFSLPREGVGEDATTALLDLVAAATPRTGSVRFLNQLFAGRDGAAIAGDLLAVALNTSLYTYKAAGPNALIERALTEHMCRLVGFEGGEGVFAPGGSMSNFAAIVMARDATERRAREEGVVGSALTLYTSEVSHYSLKKGAAMAGVGRANVRMIPCDERGRMIPAELERAIERDVEAGLRPFMINATSGTTVLGSFDPIRALAEIARRRGIWLHVDGALGMSMVLSREHRELVDGVELADSATWDAHKLMTVPLTCSVILTRERGLLSGSFSEHADYLFQEDSSDINFGERALQCGRRNDVLKLWALWKRHGDLGLGRRIDRLIEMARLGAEIVDADPELELVKRPESVNVCFEVKGVSSKRICEQLRQRERLIVGYGDVEGRAVIRVPFVNPDMTDAHVGEAIGEIRRMGLELRGAERAAAPAPEPAPCESPDG